MRSFIKDYLSEKLSVGLYDEVPNFPKEHSENDWQLVIAELIEDGTLGEYPNGNHYLKRNPTITQITNIDNSTRIGHEIHNSPFRDLTAPITNINSPQNPNPIKKNAMLAFVIKFWWVWFAALASGIVKLAIDNNWLEAIFKK